MAQLTRTGDLTSGPLLKKIILFSLPLAASSILQLLFNAADVVVVGRFAGSTALAAVGSNGALINLLVNLFVGLSLGANVVAARCFGAKDERGVQNTVQTSVTLGLVSGVLLAFVGFFAARGLLELMSCPEDVIDLSTLYLKIYFIGMPMTMLYNFNASLLRAVGDTRRPLYCLAVSGVINVVLNLVFVILFQMSVAGVALATIISQTVSALMVTVLLMKEEGPLRLDLRHLGFHKGALVQILQIGLPAGLLLAFVGFFAARGLLELMSCPEDVIDLSTLYLKIYFIGMPMTMLYNFNASLLRAVGDTRRPLYCLAVSGVINVVLNLVFVILFQMSVAGVALATIISQTVSALMVTVLLMKEEGPLRLDLRHLGFHKGTLVQILKIGLPAGLQSTLFSLSNVVIQSAVNSFGSTIVAGNSAAANIEGFIYTGMNAFAQAAVTFTSQNVGARRYDNLDRVMRNCLLCAVVVGIVLGSGAYLAGGGLLHFYSTDETVVAAGLARMKVICTSYFLCGIMDTLASCLRGRGYSVLPMIVSLVGSCLLRLVWIATIFQLFRSTTTLYISYPISWLLTASVHLACLLVVRHKMNNAGQPVKIAA